MVGRLAARGLLSRAGRRAPSRLATLTGPNGLTPLEALTWGVTPAAAAGAIGGGAYLSEQLERESALRRMERQWLMGAEGRMDDLWSDLERMRHE